MARTSRPKDPALGGGSIGPPPILERGQLFDDIGSYGLRAFSGFIREEILPQLLDRQAQRVYREMLDNSSVVGSVMFAITQAMRKVTWRVKPAESDGVKSGTNFKPGAEAAAEFVESLMEDMSHPWDDFITESLTMLGYGFSIHEIVYKRRQGLINSQMIGSSKYDDGKIGWRRLPGRGQDTILKWFFDANGAILGVTQQPYAGPILDIPIEKFLLFRTSSLKNNPEGRSILRNAYRAFYFVKRLEELEAISVERMNGFPVISVPTALIDAALAVTNGQPSNPAAAASYAAYKKAAVNIRVDEQMGFVLPSDVYSDAEGRPSPNRKYQLEFLTPQHGAGGRGDTDKIISRYKVDILMTALADFIQMGHEVRGTNNLAVTKVDMFYGAIEGWLNNHAAVMNRFGLPRLFRLNGMDTDVMPTFAPEMPARLDLDSLGQYVANIAGAGARLFPDEPLEEFLRGAAGMPEEISPEAIKAAADTLKATLEPKGPVNVLGGKRKGGKSRTNRDDAGAAA